MKAILRTIRITPQKANLVAGMVRKKPVNDALEILKYTPKKAAKILYKLLNSAVANATTNYKQEKGNLFVREIVINKGPTYKRSVPISRGRVHPIAKRTSHITVLLGIQDAAATKKTTKTDKTEEKAETATKEEKPKKAAPKSTKK